MGNATQKKFKIELLKSHRAYKPGGLGKTS
jgi:hypothetical protein